MKTKITENGGWMIIEGDLISGWVETEGLAHDKFLIPLAVENIPNIENALVLDIGANIGTHSISYAKKLAPLAGTLICFEPGATAFECLQHNAQKFESKTLLVNCAVCDIHGGTARHTVNQANVGGSVVSEQTNGEVISNEVRTISIDGFIQDSRIDLPIVFIKIDVEGYEYKVLLGAYETLKKHRPILLIEMNSFRLQENGCSHKDIYDWLLKLNYAWRIVQPESKGADLQYDIMCWPNLIEAAKTLPAG